MREALILVGGKGTRLRSITKGGQKTVVKIGNQPFLEFLIRGLQEDNFQKIYLAAGYRADEVEGVVAKMSFDVSIEIIKEKTPLGTGGAIKNALKMTSAKDVLVLNGDTYNDISYASVLDQHIRSEADISILSKAVHDASRYGVIQIDNEGAVLGFLEKTGTSEPGLINAGVYGLKTQVFKNYKSQVFSFELFLAEQLCRLHIRSIEAPGDFLDIGVPEDYYAFTQKYKDGDVYQ